MTDEIRQVVMPVTLNDMLFLLHFWMSGEVWDLFVTWSSDSSGGTSESDRLFWSACCSTTTDVFDFGSISTSYKLTKKSMIFDTANEALRQ